MLFHPKELEAAREAAEASMTSTLKRLTIAVTSGDSGNTAEVVTEGAAVPCRIAPLTGIEDILAGKLTETTRYRLFTPHDFVAAVGDRLKVDGTVFQIEFIGTPRSGDEVARMFKITQVR